MKMHPLLTLGLGLIGTYWVAKAADVSFMTAAIAELVLFLLYLLVTKTSMFHHTEGHGHHDGGSFSPAGLAIFVAILLIGTWLTGISNNFAFHMFKELGFRFWLWPSGVSRDLILWVCIAFAAARCATTHTKYKLAGQIFMVTGICIFAGVHFPQLMGAAFPSGKTGADKGKPSLPATDSALHDGGGLRVGAKLVTTVSLGAEDSPENKKEIRKHGHLLGPVIGFLKWAFTGQENDDDKSSASTPSASVTLEVTTERPAPPPSKVRATTPATLTADYGFSLEADAPIMVQYPGEEAFLFTPGGGCHQLPEPRSSGPKKFWDPNDPDNGHISLRLYRGGGHC